MSVDKSLISGSTTLLIMKLLEEKDMYGYDMIENLKQRSNHVFDLKAGTLYPILHGLEDKNYLISYEQAAGGKLRKYYSLTKSGRGFLEMKKTEWREYADAVNRVLEKKEQPMLGGNAYAGI